MLDHSTIEEQASLWLARLDADGLSAAERCELRDWINASLSHRVAFLRLEELWRQSGRLRALANDALLDDPFETDAAPVLDPSRAQGAPRRFGLSPALMAVITLASVGLAMFHGWQVAGVLQAKHTSGVGQVQTIDLADGSRLTLGSDSAVEVRLTRQQRAIELLRGEAIFEVAHDPDRRFVVHANAHQIAAIGTRFSVRRDAEQLRVVVTEGRVRLQADAPDENATQLASLMPAGSVARIDAHGVHLKSLSPRAADELLDWRSGYLAFDDTALSDVIAEFNRYHMRKLELADSAVGELRIGGNFRWSNLDGFVQILERGFQVRAEYLPGRIRLHRL